MKTAADHADRTVPGWPERAFKILQDFVQARQRGYLFTAEEVREYSWLRRLPEPPDRRAWGGILTRACRAGLIERFGYRQHREKSRHRGVSTLWRRK